MVLSSLVELRFKGLVFILFVIHNFLRWYSLRLAVEGIFHSLLPPWCWLGYKENQENPGIPKCNLF